MMTPDEREKIEERAIRRAREEAGVENRVKNLETEVSELQAALAWARRAMWAGGAYLLTEIWRFLSQGGTLK